MARRDALTGRDGSTSRTANGGDEGEFNGTKYGTSVSNRVKMFVWRLATAYQ